MLIAELRALLKRYNEEELQRIISEMYKSMPKKLREEKKVDMLLEDVHTYMSIGKSDAKQAEPLNFERLTSEIEDFLEYAYNQYYMVPNHFVHKKERPKWRFKVKGYIKELQGISIATKEGKKATELLQKLFEMLSYACGYYLFNTENPFKSVGIEQGEFLDIVIKRKIGSEINPEVLKSVIKMVIVSEVDRETLHTYLIQILIMSLKSTDSKMMAIDQCKLLKHEIDKSSLTSSKKSWDYNNYKLEEQSNNLVEMIFRIQMELYEYDEAIQYFNENYRQRNDEIKLYVLLHLLLDYELVGHWLMQYESALKKGIEPREDLQMNYQQIRERKK